MAPIAEEQELAFSNLVYTDLEANQEEQSREVDMDKVTNQYENVGVDGHKYENVGNEESKYENIPDNAEYENVPETKTTGLRSTSSQNNLQSNLCQEGTINQNEYENVLTDTKECGDKIGEHYENYDFGENGIYQNILFKTKPIKQSESDVYSQLKSLKEAVSRVNDILMKETQDEDDISTSDNNVSIKDEKEDTTKDLKKPEDVKSKGKVSSLRGIFSFTKTKETPMEAVKVENEKRNPEKKEEKSSNGVPTSVLKRWSSTPSEATKSPAPALFTSTERQIVASFLQTVKTELSTA